MLIFIFSYRWDFIHDQGVYEYLSKLFIDLWGSPCEVIFKGLHAYYFYC